ncbi:hypothetical protein [Streptomyces sp. LN325]
MRELTEQAPAQHELIEMAYAHAVAKASTNRRLTARPAPGPARPGVGSGV